MRMGIVMQRQRKRRAALLKRRMMMAALAAGVIAALGFSPWMQTQIIALTGNVQTFSQSLQQEITLPGYDVYALQLAVFDSGERAASELQRLQALGVRCVIWQRERMRLVADTAYSREALNRASAKGQEAYVIRDTLQPVSLRLSADSAGVAEAQLLLELPDRTLERILTEPDTAIAQITEEVKLIAAQALGAHPENELYTQLAQSLAAWCDLMQKALEESGEADIRSYGAATMYTLCRDLRQALSRLSTASAQRTPSTAADVMPPA